MVITMLWEVSPFPLPRCRSLRGASLASGGVAGGDEGFEDLQT